MPFDTQAVVNAAWGEPLTVTRAGPGTTHVVTGTRHLKGVTEGRTSFGAYAIQRERFTLAADALPFTPKLRDTVAPFGLPPRVVTEVGGSPWLKFHTLDAQYPSLADDLDATATVFRPAPTPTAEGMRTPNLAAVYTNVACRLQPDTMEVDFEAAGRVTTRRKFVAVFGSAVVLLAGDVLEVAGVKYEVKSQGEVEGLGVLTFASVERVS